MGARTQVEVAWQGEVEHGHATVELEGGTVRGWWTVEGGKGRGWSRVDPGATGLSEEEAEAGLDAAVEAWWQGA